jgi:hypothetical protein
MTKHISETVVMHIGAAPADVLAAIDRLAIARDPFAGVKPRGTHRFGVTWRPDPAAPGRVDVEWDLRVEADDQDGSYLSSTRRFTADDDAAWERLRADWRYVGPMAATLGKTVLRAVKRTAETRAAEPVALPHLELLAA